MSRKKAKVMLGADVDEQIVNVEEETELTEGEDEIEVLTSTADDPTTNPEINYEQLVNNFPQFYSMDDLLPPPPEIPVDDEANLLKDGEEE